MDDPTKWPALESSPEIFSEFCWSSGMLKKYAVNEVFSFEPELMDFTPKPVFAVSVFLPGSIDRMPRVIKFMEKHTSGENYVDNNVFYFEQVPQLQDACGSISMIHALLNNVELLDKDSLLLLFKTQTESLSADKRGELLATSTSVNAVHSSLASQGQSQPTDVGNSAGHFICFTIVNEVLWELDGMIGFPINHGECSTEQLLYKVADIVQNDFMSLNPAEIRFAMMAVGPNQE